MRPIPVSWVAMLLLAAVARAQSADLAAKLDAVPAPVGVSPGDARRFVPAAGACPTFTWTQATGAGYELQVFAVGDAEPAEALPVLRVSLPAGAAAWAPPGDRCLIPGERYAWSVRALPADAGGGGAWSAALLFEVREAPTVAELQRALEVVQRYLGTAQVGEQPFGTAEADLLPARAVAAVESPQPREQAPAGGGPATAVRGEVPDVAGETYGVRGVANSPDGAGGGGL